MEKNILDCGDNSCRFAETKGGMRTNGGCRCLRILEPIGPGRKEAMHVLRLLLHRFQQVKDERDNLRKLVSESND